MTDAVRNNFAMLEEQRPVLKSVVAQGNTVVATGREQGRIRETGQDYDVEFVQFHTFDGGLLVRMRLIVADAQA